MQTSYLEKLEYNKILEILEGYCKTYIGKHISLSLLPSNNKENVIYMLKETTQACDLITEKGTLPIDSIANIEIDIKNLESFNSLSAKSLLDIAKILRVSRNLKEYFNIENSDNYNLLTQYFISLYSNQNTEKNIFNKILDENTINDNASPKLSSIRNAEKRLNQNIKDKLKSIMHSAKYSKYLQESIITIRNDRFVVPVKEEYRGQIKGFVHDVSASGSTLFIEPLLVFELNNEINKLKVEETIEIAKILEELSKSLFPITKELRINLELIGKLDFIFAKANFSIDVSAIEPIINEEKYISLIKARHPLIPQDKVVPVNINIGNTFSSLAVTGPNTGGKTVLLKTVGLLTCMALSGLHLPAGEGSSIYVFDNIFVDIGDDQSIAESLSTFSSHMINIVEILKHVTSDSLILLDELGSGTDPKEGSKLAIAILDKLYNIGALTISTTHYTDIKNFALVTQGFENASFEFDTENLMPTYKLIIGIPGKSNAFEISKKLGLDDEIIHKAISLMDSNDISIEELLKNIYDTRQKIEYQEIETSKNLNQAQDLRKRLEKDYSENEAKAEKYILDSKKEARLILEKAKEDASNVIREISNNKSLKELNTYRNDLNSKIRELNKDYIRSKDSRKY